jgi:Asp-tRNA(Asn)/Glu-tRNA(Gln) amidotransferase A subunit family amidase
MQSLDTQRRQFLRYFSGLGLGGTLLPGVLWAQSQQSATPEITQEMLKNALALSGLTFTEEEQKAMVQSANQNLNRYRTIRDIKIPSNVSPPYHFSALTPGMKVKRAAEPLKFSRPTVKRPAKLEDVAFWPVIELAQLLRTKQVTSVELTQMYLARLHRYNEKLNCVVTFLDDLALEQAQKADAEIAAGSYKGLLHGIPWGAKDIMAVKGHKTTWGSAAFKDQVIDEESSVVEMLRDAGAVLLAKLATGELAQGDRWFGGQTKNPWNMSQGSSGSSAGPGSATAAGLVGFAIGTETSGSILSPSARCGVTGLRPTFGRVSRYGVMALSWTQDRLGPMCRYAEDCAIVMSVIAKPDNRDMSVSEIAFNWNAQLDIKKLRVGFIDDGTPIRPSDKKTMDAVEALGIKLIPVKVPDFTNDTANFGVESAAFFDEMVRSGGYRQMSNPPRADGFKSAHLIPAVEYLQSQRVRMMMMTELAKATEHVDVYLAPAGVPPPQPPTDAAAVPAQQGNGRRQGATQRHSTMANSACYPAVAVPNGFGEDGSPLSISFFARPFGEPELLALVKAYQDTAGFHRQTPKLDG